MKIAAEGLNLQNSLLFSLLSGNLDAETGSIATGSATTQSFATEEFLSPREKPRIGGVVRGAISLCDEAFSLSGLFRPLRLWRPQTRS